MTCNQPMGVEDNKVVEIRDALQIVITLGVQSIGKYRTCSEWCKGEPYGDTYRSGVGLLNILTCMTSVGSTEPGLEGQCSTGKPLAN